MELEELSIECQTRVFAALDQTVPNMSNSDWPNTDDAARTAIRTLLIPTMITAYHHALSQFYQKLLDFTIVHMETVIANTDTLDTFFEEIPVQIMKQVIASDSLALPEYDIWQLALGWACRKANVSKSAVESQIKSNGAIDDEEDVADDDSVLVSAAQLSTLKAILAPLIPLIRFKLMDPDRYAASVDILTFFLSMRRAVELQRFFWQSDGSTNLDVKRNGRGDDGSKLTNRESWVQLRCWISSPPPIVQLAI